jgi:hypothetical protein
MTNKMLLFVFFLLSAQALFAQEKEPWCAYKKKKLLTENFEGTLNRELWQVEMDSLPFSRVHTENKKLILDTKGGVTVWLKKELKGNLLIEYQRSVQVSGGSNDRLSDLNQFWMATDPQNPDLFTRKGKFAEYDSLSLYYVGFGGNHNTTTRFRKYLGNGDRLILMERNEIPFLLEANKNYLIQIAVFEGVISFWVNGLCFFEYTDPDPLTQGYFGFRSTGSRQHISKMKIFSLEKG